MENEGGDDGGKKMNSDSTKVNQEELKKWQRAQMKKEREWEDSYEGISYAARIECPAGHDDALVIQVLHDILRHYRMKAIEFIYFLMTSGVRGYVSPIFVPGGAEDQKKTLILLNFSQRMTKKEKMTTIAHEIAHGILDQPNGGRKAEQAADDLCEKWGFGRAYMSYEKFRA